MCICKLQLVDGAAELIITFFLFYRHIDIIYGVETEDNHTFFHHSDVRV